MFCFSSCSRHTSCALVTGVQPFALPFYFLLATVGIALGMLLAFGINQMLMGKYELPRLPLVYLPIGAVALWLLGQIAVFWPARRAAAVPPAVATRRDRKSTRLNSSH